jgi:hypothetical protein
MWFRSAPNQTATPRFYQPFATRTPALLILLALTLTLLGLTETARKRLPSRSNLNIIGTVNSTLNGRDVFDSNAVYTSTTMDTH